MGFADWSTEDQKKRQKFKAILLSFFFFFRFLYCFQSCREIERATRTSESVGPAIHPPNYRAGLEVFSIFYFFIFLPLTQGLTSQNSTSLPKKFLHTSTNTHNYTTHSPGLHHSSVAVCRLHVARRVCCVIVCAS